MTADKNCIPINTNESRFSKITELIKSINISFERFFKAQDSYNTCFPFVTTFAPKILVSHRLDREKPLALWKALSKC